MTLNPVLVRIKFTKCVAFYLKGCFAFYTIKEVFAIHRLSHMFCIVGRENANGTVLSLDSKIGVLFRKREVQYQCKKYALFAARQEM